MLIDAKQIAHNIFINNRFREEDQMFWRHLKLYVISYNIHISYYLNL